ncbi:MAG: chemotaxis protein CheW [Cyanobacteria bacterium P01_D01_bin.6]
MELDNPLLELSLPKNQYILTQAGTRRIAFPTKSVVSILLVERSQVLALPFYHEALLGIVHHQGQMVPLVTLQHLLEGNPSQLREVFNAVQLSESTGLPGLGLVIDRLLGNCSEEQVSTDSTIEQFQPNLLDPKLWQPQRWVSLA